MAQQYSIVAEIIAKTDSFTKAMNEAGKKTDELAKGFATKTKAISEGFTNVGKSLTTKVSLPIVAMGTMFAKTAIDFESAFAGVRKTVDGTEADFAKLKKGIRDMSKEIPQSAEGLAEIMEMGGQLGISTNNLLGFTRTIADIAEATNLTAEQAGQSFAQFANIVGMSQNDFDRLGSSVVALGNNMATTESDIVNMSMRLAGVGKQVGLSEAEIMALSASMSSLGINAEAGGSAMTTVMKKIQNAVSDGGKDLTGFAKASGMSSAEFAEAWKNDPITALDAFIKGLAESGESGENLNQILGDLGIKGINETDTLLRLAGASELLGEAVDISSTAWEENNALSNEAQQRYETTASKLQILWNNVKDVALTIGDAFLPMINSAIDGLQPFIEKIAGLAEKLNDLSPKTLTVIAVIAGLVASIGPVLVGLGGFIQLVGFVGGALGALSAPVLAVIAVIGLLVAGFTLAYQNSETFRNGIHQVFTKVKDVVLNLFGATVEFFREKIQVIKDFWAENGSQIQQAFENVFNAILAVIDFVMPAIEFVIRMVLDNVKGVFNGALNIILGLIKTFASLFTGDWKGLWEGVKQLLSGALEFVWNLINLMMLGKILTIFKSFGTGAINLFKNMSSSITGFFKGLGDDALRISDNMVSGVIGFFKNLLTNATSTFNSIKSAITNPIETARSVINTIVNAIKGYFTNMRLKFPELSINPFTKARDLISGVIEKIKGFFSGLKLSFPKIAMPALPHFSLKGKFSLNPPSVPKIGIDWYAKGGLMLNPTAFGMNGNNLMVGGEAGAEAILPLTKSVLGTIGNQIFANMDALKGATNNTTTNTYGDIIVTVENGDKKKANDIATEIMTGLKKRGK